MDEINIQKDGDVLKTHNSANQFRERFLIVVALITPARGGLQLLSRMTSINYDRWRNAVTGRSAPSIDMVLALGDLKPEWFNWMMRGEIGPEQTAPPDAELSRAKFALRIAANKNFRL